MHRTMLKAISSSLLAIALFSVAGYSRDVAGGGRYIDHTNDATGMAPDGVLANPPALIELTPETVTVERGGVMFFTAVVKDQAGKEIDYTGPMTWTVSGGGEMDSSLFIAGLDRGGPYTVTASIGTISGTAEVVVESPSNVKMIELLSPNGGETFNVGDAMKITYKGVKEELAGIVVYYSANDGRSWQFITDNSYIGVDDPDWGTYTWVIPAKLQGTSTLSQGKGLIKLEEYNEGSVNSISAAPFSILEEGSAILPGAFAGGSAPGLVRGGNGLFLSGDAVLPLRFEVLSANGAIVRSGVVVPRGNVALSPDRIGSGRYLLRMTTSRTSRSIPLLVP